MDTIIYVWISLLVVSFIAGILYSYIKNKKLKNSIVKMNNEEVRHSIVLDNFQIKAHRSVISGSRANPHIAQDNMRELVAVENEIDEIIESAGKI